MCGGCIARKISHDGIQGMRMSGLELQTCTAGYWHGEQPAMINGVATDTRKLNEGDAFVALRGPNYNGHDFAAEAANRGAAALIGDAEGMDSWQGIALPKLEVQDSLRALGDIAGHWRRTLSVPVVAITGSYGKTTLRAMLEHVLALKGMRVTATRSNDNNLIGVPQTLLRIRPDDDVALIECGISESGEMPRLAAMARPDVAVITGIGEAHAEGLGGIAEIAAEKAQLFDALAADGCAVLGSGVSTLLADSLWDKEANVLDVDARDADTVAWHMSGCSVTLSYGTESHSFDLPLPAIHWAQDAALAATILACMQLASLAEVAQAMSTWEPVGGRMRSIAGLHGCTLLDDSYNANPASMAAALDTLRHVSGRRIAVLGDMAELGADSGRLHAGLDVSGLDAVLLVGDEMNALSALPDEVRHMADVPQVVTALRGMGLGKGDTLLIKGSRCMHMERVVDALREGGDAV